jgi:VWFA-related protein
LTASTSSVPTRLLLSVLFAASFFSGAAAFGQAPAPPVPKSVPATPAAAATPAGQKTPDTTTPGSAEESNGGNVPFTINVRANLVDLVFTVTDKHGRFITGLKRQDFGLLDDGRPPTSVVSFTQQTDLPLRLGVMLDTSSSIRSRFKFEQDAALDFFLQVLHPGDKGFVEGFDVETAVTQDFTGNISNLDAGIRKLRPGGGTALFDSLYNTCKNQMLTLKETTPVRKAIVLVSDGDDNYSRSLESDAHKKCQRSEPNGYANSTDVSPTRGHGGDVLRTITEATGGQVFFPEKLEDVALGFRDIEEELRSQYSLEYRPADFKQNGSFRTIYLQATEGKYHVRVKKGYFATLAPQ